MLFRQLFDATSGTYSYLLASRPGGEALIIDPVLEKVDRYIALLADLNLRLIKAIDTHLGMPTTSRRSANCATGRNASPSWASRPAPISFPCGSATAKRSISTASAVARSTRRAIPMIPTASFCPRPRVHWGYFAHSRGTGRTDFQNGDPRAQYELIFSKLLKLPEETLIYPAHDYKGDTVSDDR